jgi:hypothetical protein
MQPALQTLITRHRPGCAGARVAHVGQIGADPFALLLEILGLARVDDVRAPARSPTNTCIRPISRASGDADDLDDARPRARRHRLSDDHADPC